ncbi:MAG: phosphoenolpyruvate--protein phosphotransferase [Sandaracinaceae bacterium]
MSDDRARLPGISASPGIVVGTVTVFDRRSVPVARRHIPQSAVEAEVARLHHAMDDARAEVEVLRDGLADGAADHRLLLETQLLMLGDALLSESAAARIREERTNAEWALRSTVDGMQARLRAADEAYFRERADDVAHVGEHVLRVLTGMSRSLPDIDAPTILVANDLSPAEAAALPADLVRGIVTDAGSASSHTAILARALNVPSVVGVADVTRAVGPGDRMIVDGLRGEVVVHPDPDEEVEASERANRFRAFEVRLRGTEQRKAETRDGVRMTLLANVELEVEASEVRAEGADGVGLYRTEFLYLDRAEPPSEAEQTALYRRVARRVSPAPVTFRTFDLGGDKMPQGMRRGPNPALGLRALRVAFERPELLVTQLRSLLRAAVEGNVRIMFPMVSGVADWRRARVLLDRAREDLDASGEAYGPVLVGSMLEVPSALIVADRLAPLCDFFSIGTNDLTQYTLAVDRGDPRVAHLASSLDPAVLRLIHQATQVAADHDRPIAVCGDLAADPVATPLLVGLGLTQLSMARAGIPLVREVVARLDLAEARAVAEEALEQDGASAVERLVSSRYAEQLGDLWHEQGIELPRC